jgi:hypothetical protein
VTRCSFGGCVATENLRVFKITVGDDAPLRVQPEFCDEHTDQILIRVGHIIGEMLQGKAAPF